MVGMQIVPSSTPHGLCPVENTSLKGHSWQDSFECRPQRLFKVQGNLFDGWLTWKQFDELDLLN